MTCSSSSLSVSESMEEKPYHHTTSPKAVIKAEATAGCSVTLKDYSFDVHDTNSNENKRLLHDINFACRPGELLAIMGPSGCGKTTLLNSIARRSKGKETGELHFNGRPMTRSQLLNEELISYVMSKDSHFEFLSVEETLAFAAQLKMVNDSKEERYNRAEALIVTLDLTSCRKTLVGGTWTKGLSTGEMRRVSIAVELLDNPDVVLLDEPTTGLDSSRAASLMPVLKNLALDLNKTVIMTIHQPSSDVFANFDKVLFMSKGRIIYCGPAMAAMTYANARFAKLGMESCTKPVNPADFMLDLISVVPEEKIRDQNDTRIRLTQSELEEWAEYYRTSAACAQLRSIHDSEAQRPMELRGLKRSGCKRWWTAFGVLYRRISLNSIRNPAETFLLALAHVLICGYIGMIFFQSMGEPEVGPGTSTLEWISDMVAYVQGDEHALPLALEDKVNWTPDDGSGGLLPSVPPLMGDAIYPGYTYSYDDYGHELTPASNPERTLDVPAINYELGPFPLTIPDSLESTLELFGCIRDRLGSIPNLDYGELFSVERYRHWNFEEIPDNIVEAMDNIEDITRARDILAIVYRLVATGDFAYNHINWDDLPDYDLYDEEGNLSPWIRTSNGTSDKTGPIDVGIPYWLKVMACYGDELNAMLGCLNFPKLPNLRDQPLIAAIGVDVSCEKPPTSNPSLRRLFGKTLDSNTSFHLLRRLLITDEQANRRRLQEEYTPDILNPDASADIQHWIHSFMNAASLCDHELCHEVDALLENLKSDLANKAVPLASVLHIGGVMLFLAAYLQFAAFDAVLVFQQERPIFNRETNNQMYSPSSYFVAKNIANLPFQYFHSMLGFITIFFLSGIPSSVFFQMFGMAIATVWAMYGFCFFFSAISKTLEVAILMVPAMVVTMLITTGFFVREVNFPAWIGWTKYFSSTRWSFHGFALMYFPVGGTFAGLPNETCLSIFGVTSRSVGQCYGALFAMGLIYRVAAFVALNFLFRQVGLEA